MPSLDAARCTCLGGRFFLHGSASSAIYTLSLHDALPISKGSLDVLLLVVPGGWLESVQPATEIVANRNRTRSEEHTSELQSRLHLVCRLLLEKKKKFAHLIPLNRTGLV